MPDVDRGEPGFRLTGTWPYASGCDHASWVAVTAPVVRERPGPLPDTRCFLIPAGRFRIQDDWFVAGLKGTGSKSVVAKDLFVPAHRGLSYLDVARGRAPGTAVNPSPLFRLPVVPTLTLVAAGTAIGIAHGAIEAFRERVSAGGAVRPGAPVREDVASAAPLAPALAAVDAARLLLLRDAEELMRHAAAGERPGRARCARYLVDGAFAVAAAAGAVDRLFAASGASALRETSPLQRAFRDLHAMAAHSTLRLDAMAELLARIELGLPLRSALALI
jgi:3-hydroxy-9,10-secoandrosta-1,3,5(10)-triene-9,17-dione monooxygenase